MRSLRLNTLVLAVLAPAIVLSTLGLGYQAYASQRAIILEGFDRKLAALSSATSAFINTDETLALLAEKDALVRRGEDPEQHPVYLKYVLPMRRIRERAGLTFLYTQVLRERQPRQCVYLLDGTVGQGHSPIGSVDTIPADDWDVALRVLHDGEVAQTAIRPWEQWGLLKCGWAPMYGADGSVKGMTGADVEITVIRRKTYVALLQVFAAGALALVLAGLVSVRVARTLTQPLGTVREAALRIASGDYRVRCHVGAPREMRALAATVNSVAEVMERTVEGAQRRLSAWWRRQAGRALLDRLAMPPHRTAALSIELLPGSHASGFVVSGPLALVWVGRQEPEEVDARKTARDIAHVAARLVNRHGHAAAARLQHLLAGRVCGCAVLDVQRWSIDTCGEGLSISVEGGAEFAGSQTTLAPGSTASLPAGIPIAAVLRRPAHHRQEADV